VSISTPNGLPPINPVSEPAAIRNGNTAAKQAYSVGLEFEQLLVQQLSQEMASTTGTSDGSDGTDSSDGSSGGLMGSDPASSTYASLLPQALTTGVMSDGGLGIAMQIAAGIDPALRTSVSAQAGSAPAGSAAAGSAASAAAGSAAAGSAAGTAAPPASGGGAV
jgi:Rod binding domain-containing protein